MKGPKRFGIGLQLVQQRLKVLTILGGDTVPGLLPKNLIKLSDQFKRSIAIQELPRCFLFPY